jgi:hypothetical protein
MGRGHLQIELADYMTGLWFLGGRRLREPLHTRRRAGRRPRPTGCHR